MDLCMGMGMRMGMGMVGLQDQGRGLSNNIDHNGYYAAPIHAASADVKPANFYEFPMDAIHLLQENLATNDNSCLGYSCLPWHDEIFDHPAALVFADPLWQRQALMMQHQQPRFEFLPDLVNVPYKGTLHSASTNFEEHQAALVSQVLGRGMPCNGNEAVQAEQVQVHLQPPLEDGTLAAIGGSMINSCGDFEEKSLNNYFPPAESTQSLAVALLQNQRNQLYASCCKEPPAKRPRSSGCYTLEDVLQKLPLDAASGLHTVRNNQTSPWNIFPAAPQFSSDFNLPSPRLSCSSASSLERDSDEKQHRHLFCRKPAYVSVEPQSIAARHRRKKIGEKIRCLEKLIPFGSKLDTARMLEEASKYVKFLQAQVHALEYMSSSPSPFDSNESLRSAGTLNPSFPSTSSAFGRVDGSMSSSWNVNTSPLTNALAQQTSSKSLSAQQMLHILVTSPGIQRKLFSEEKCVGTVEEYQKLFSTEALIPYNFSNFHSKDTIPASD